jgi:hypothetical protein
MTNKMPLSRLIYCSLFALHVSNDIFDHHQEHLNCIYSFWYYSCRRLVSRKRWNSVSDNGPFHMTPSHQIIENSIGEPTYGKG